MDVHDVGDYMIGDEWRVLEPGMALTIEPGIHPPERAACRSVSSGSACASRTMSWSPRPCQVLTDGVPKDVEAIEKLMAQPRVPMADPNSAAAAAPRAALRELDVPSSAAAS